MITEYISYIHIVEFWNGVLGMNIKEKSDKSATLSFDDNQVSIPIFSYFSYLLRSNANRLLNFGKFLQPLRGAPVINLSFL